jgi:hypothetical protein
LKVLVTGGLRVKIGYVTDRFLTAFSVGDLQMREYEHEIDDFGALKTGYVHAGKRAVGDRLYGGDAEDADDDRQGTPLL